MNHQQTGNFIIKLWKFTGSIRLLDVCNVKIIPAVVVILVLANVGNPWAGKSANCHENDKVNKILAVKAEYTCISSAFKYDEDVDHFNLSTSNPVFSYRYYPYVNLVMTIILLASPIIRFFAILSNRHYGTLKKMNELMDMATTDGDDKEMDNETKRANVCYQTKVDETFIALWHKPEFFDDGVSVFWCNFWSYGLIILTTITSFRFIPHFVNFDRTWRWLDSLILTLAFEGQEAFNARDVLNERVLCNYLEGTIAKDIITHTVQCDLVQMPVHQVTLIVTGALLIWYGCTYCLELICIVLKTIFWYKPTNFYSFMKCAKKTAVVTKAEYKEFASEFLTPEVCDNLKMLPYRRKRLAFGKMLVKFYLEWKSEKEYTSTQKPSISSNYQIFPSSMNKDKTTHPNNTPSSKKSQKCGTVCAAIFIAILVIVIGVLIMVLSSLATKTTTEDSPSQPANMTDIKGETLPHKCRECCLKYGLDMKHCHNYCSDWEKLGYNCIFPIELFMNNTNYDIV